MEGLSDYTALTTPGRSFALAGPSVKLDPAHLPVRGDLAHIRMAGKVFVPHYVVPVKHLVNGAGARVLKAGKPDAEVLAELPTGAEFHVLDLAGAWAWGQVGEDGVVGYVAANSIHPAS